MQHIELSFLAKLPISQRSLIVESNPLILGIVVTEIKGTDKPVHTSKEEQNE